MSRLKSALKKFRVKTLYISKFRFLFSLKSFSILANQRKEGPLFFAFFTNLFKEITVVGKKFSLRRRIFFGEKRVIEHMVCMSLSVFYDFLIALCALLNK